MSPFNAWTVLKGLETLDIRVERMTSTASVLADFLAEHAAVRDVRYPGRHDHPQSDVHTKQMKNGGSLIAFSLNGGQPSAFKLLNALNVISISNNLGDAKSLICHPATTTHRTLSDEERAMVGLDDSWVRLSVGLEHPDDLKNDLDQALAQCMQSR